MTYQDEQRKLIQELASKDAANFGATIVPMKTNYLDDSRCLTIVAVPSNSLRESIVRDIIEPLKAIEPDHYFFPPESIHTTVKSIRTSQNPPQFTEEDIHKVADMLTAVVPTLPQFTIQLEQLVRFPTSVAIFGTTHENQRTVIQTLDQELNRIGVPDNKTYGSDTVFFANVTVCRFTHQPSAKFLQAISSLQISLESWTVNEITLNTNDAVMSPKSVTIQGRYQLSELQAIS